MCIVFQEGKTLELAAPAKFNSLSTKPQYEKRIKELTSNDALSKQRMPREKIGDKLLNQVSATILN